MALSKHSVGRPVCRSDTRAHAERMDQLILTSFRIQETSKFKVLMISISIVPFVSFNLHNNL